MNTNNKRSVVSNEIRRRKLNGNQKIGKLYSEPTGASECSKPLIVSSPAESEAWLTQDWHKLHGRYMCEKDAESVQVLLEDDIDWLKRESKDSLPNEYLDELADDIGEEWKEVGLQLGFSRARLEQLEMDNCKDSKTVIVFMLIEWRDKHGNTMANKKKLQSVLNSFKLVRHMKEKSFNSKQQFNDLAKGFHPNSNFWQKIYGFAATIAQKTPTVIRGHRNLQQLNRIKVKLGITDEDFYTLAENIGFEWKRIGLMLGLTKARLEQLRQDCMDTRTAIAKMFIDWRNKAVGSCSSLTDKLKGVLQKYGNFVVS